MDCRGLLLCAARDCGLLTDGEITAMPEMVNYLREPDGVTLPELLKKYCNYKPYETLKTSVAVGDIVCVRFDAHPQHLMVITKPTKWGPLAVHAWQHYGVIEQRIDDAWLQTHRARVHGIFSLKGIQAAELE